MNSPVAAARPPWPGWLKLVLLGVVGLVVWELLAFPRTPHVRLVDRSFLASMYFLLAWRFWRAAQRPTLSEPLRRALQFISAGHGAGAVATLYLLVDGYLRPAAPSIFSFADTLFLGMYPVMSIGLLRLPRAERTAAGVGRILIDGVIFLVGIGVPLWLFAVEPDLHRTTGIEALLVVVWPCTAFGGILVVNAALLTKAPVPTRGALGLLLAGTGLLWFSDLIFSLDAASGVITRSPVNWINLSNAIALGLCLLAAWRYETDPPAATESGRASPFSPAPLITLFVVSGWLVLSSTLHPGAIALGRILPSLIVLFAALFIREMLVIRASLRSAALEAQREGQVRFEALVRDSSDVILIINRAGQMVFVSPAAQPALGVGPESLVGHSLDELVHPEDTARYQEFQAQLLPQSASRAFTPLRLRHHDGSYRHFEATGANLLREPTVAGWVINLRDVSDRVTLEERLHRAGKMEAVGRLAGGIAHDFNNLLAAIMAGSELAEFDLPPGHPARRELDTIRQASRRGAALAGKLLSFGRRGNSMPALLKPGEAVQSLQPLLQSMVGASLQLQTRIDPGTGFVRVDPEGFEQAILNLVDNACDASAPGGKLTLIVERVRLAAALATPYLSVPPGRYVVIRVEDQGSGMDAATQARLFEPFFTTKAQGKGTGLGLAALYGLAQSASGGITVDSQPGSGTTISLWLPEIADTAQTRVASAAPFGSAGGTETILLVEDEDLVRLTAERILTIKGYRVISAASADDARRVLAAHQGPLHLLLTDVIMPGDTGPVLARELVSQRPDLKVIFISGYTGQELEIHGIDRTKSRLLMKPFSGDQLGAKVREALADRPGMA